MQSFHGMIVFETGDFRCGPFVLQPLSDREFASYPFHFFGNGLVQNPRVYFVVLMSVCPSIFTTDSIEILLASATVANVCLAIKWCYKINFELCKKEKVFKTEDLLWWSAWGSPVSCKSLIFSCGFQSFKSSPPISQRDTFRILRTTLWLLVDAKVILFFENYIPCCSKNMRSESVFQNSQYVFFYKIT